MRASRLAAVGCALAAVTAACSTVLGIGDLPAAPIADAAPPSVAPPTPWILGASDPETGRFGSIAPTLQNGWSIAEKYVNAHGGVLGRPIQFVEVDDTSSTTVALGAAESSLTTAGASIVLGPFGAAQVDAVHQTYSHAHILTLTAGGTSDDFDSFEATPDRFAFRTVADESVFMRALVAALASGPPCADSVVIHVDDEPPKHSEYDIFKVQGGKSTTDYALPLDAGITDYSQAAGSLAQPVDCAILLIDEIAATAVLSRLHSYVPARIFVGPYVDVPRFADLATTLGAQVYGVGPDRGSGPSFDAFRSIVATERPDAAGGDVAAYLTNEFDAAILAAAAIAQAGGVDDHRALRDALVAVSATGTTFGPDGFGAMLDAIARGEDVDYQGASGPVDLDPQSGTVHAGVIAWRVDSGRFVPISGPTY